MEKQCNTEISEEAILMHICFLRVSFTAFFLSISRKNFNCDFYPKKKKKNDLLICLPFILSFQFDPAFQRFQAMRVSHFEHFKPTGRSFRVGFFLVVAPIIFFALAFKTHREGREKKFRNGEVSYRDRQFKFI